MLKLSNTNSKSSTCFIMQCTAVVLIHSIFLINAHSSCSTEDYSSSGLFYSAGWPKGYNSGTCYHRIYVPAGKELRIAVMNLNLRNARVFCDNANDNFEIRGLLKLFIISLLSLDHGKSCSFKEVVTKFLLHQPGI